MKTTNLIVCQCKSFTGVTPCTSLATQEDLLCDTCRKVCRSYNRPKEDA